MLNKTLFVLLKIVGKNNIFNKCFVLYVNKVQLPQVYYTVNELHTILE